MLVLQIITIVMNLTSATLVLIATAKIKKIRHEIKGNQRLLDGMRNVK